MCMFEKVFELVDDLFWYFWRIFVSEEESIFLMINKKLRGIFIFDIFCIFIILFNYFDLEYVKARDIHTIAIRLSMYASLRN